AVPASESGRTEEVRTYRPVHNIGHFRYVECGWLDDRGSPDGDITPFADVLFPFDPALRDRKGSELADQPIQRNEGTRPLIEERYSVDGSGVIDVTITDVESGYQAKHRIERPTLRTADD
ncbi:MAG: Hsp70 family protein, partial [Myxococcota bacterium]